MDDIYAAAVEARTYSLSPPGKNPRPQLPASKESTSLFERPDFARLSMFTTSLLLRQPQPPRPFPRDSQSGVRMVVQIQLLPRPRQEYLGHQISSRT